MKQNNVIIDSVKYWLKHTIIDFNFCPFAQREFVNRTIHYEVCRTDDLESRLVSLENEFKSMDEDPKKETSLLIFPSGLESFFDYLDFLSMANELLSESGYEGTYQLASFHPDYCFNDVKHNDPSNFTNRSPFPIIHILREESLEKALEHYDQPEKIPERNIRLAMEQGSEPFLKILEKSLKTDKNLD